MANELGYRDPAGTTGLTVYFQRMTPTGAIWNGTSHVTYAAADWSTYKIAATDKGGGLYQADMPTASAGRYYILAFVQAGGSPATTDQLKGAVAIEWSGTAEIPLSSLISAGGGPFTVDQDWHGDESLTVIDAATREPISGATVTAYVASQFATLGTGAPVVATTTTDASGHWSLSLNSGTYTLTFVSSGQETDQTIVVPLA